MAKALLLFATLCLFTGANLSAQRVLLLEKKGRDQAQRLMEGDELTFRMKGDNFWQSGRITELRPDIQAIVMNERYILLDEIEALRFTRSNLAGVIGPTLMTFGVGWSTWALIGYATDGNPDTAYSSFDATVSATAVATGFLMWKLFRRRKIKLNDRNRLRILDLTF